MLLSAEKRQKVSFVEAYKGLRVFRATRLHSDDYDQKEDTFIPKLSVSQQPLPRRSSVRSMELK